MHQAGVTNSLGRIDQLWREGYTYYTQKHFKAAEQDFHQCMALNPAQVGCSKYDSLATQNFAKDVPLPNPSNSNGIPVWVWITAGGGVVVLLLVVLMFSRRRRGGPGTGSGMGQPAPTPPSSSAPSPLPPKDTPAPPPPVPVGGPPSDDPATYR